MLSNRNLLHRLTQTTFGPTDPHGYSADAQIRPLALELSCFERLREVYNTVANATWDKPGPRQRLIADLVPCLEEAREQRNFNAEHALRDLIKALEAEDKRDQLSLDDIAGLVGVDTWETISDRVMNNVADNAWTYAKEQWKEENRWVEPSDGEEELTWDRLGDEEKERRVYKLEEEITREGFEKYVSALAHQGVFDGVLAEYGLSMEGVKFKHDGKWVVSDFDYRIFPTGGRDRWRNPASLIFGYLQRSGDFDVDGEITFTSWVRQIGSHRDVVLHFLDHLVEFYDEGAEMSAKRVFERNFEW